MIVSVVLFVSARLYNQHLDKLEAEEEAELEEQNSENNPNQQIEPKKTK